MYSPKPPQPAPGATPTIPPPPRPASPAPLFENIPPQLRERDCWVVWRYELREGADKWTKVPYRARHKGARPASSTDPASWTSYGHARAVYELGGYDGVGFVFAPDGGIVGIDLDHCLTPVVEGGGSEGGAVTEQAKRFVRALNSYTEVSPSETGMKVFCFGALPADARRIDSTGRIGGGKKNGNYEMYEYDRFFTVTGLHVGGSPQSVEERTAELQAVYFEAFPVPPALSIVGPGGGFDGQSSASLTSPVLTDDEIIKLASSAKNGVGFMVLWGGDTSAYKSASEADFAMCTRLAFYTQDSFQIERIMAGSGLNTGRWERIPGYRSRTIDKALGISQQHYKGSAPARPHLTLVPPFEGEIEPPTVHHLGALGLRTKSPSDCQNCTGLRQEIIMLRLENAALRNAVLRQAAPTLIETAKEIDRLASSGALTAEGDVRVNYDRIARRTGFGRNTVARHIQVGEQAGLFGKRSEREIVPVKEEGTDRVIGRRFNQQVFLRNSQDRDLAGELAAIANYKAPEGEVRKWGGVRLSCPKHPDAKVVVRKFYECAECGDRLDSKMAFAVKSEDGEWVEDAASPVADELLEKLEKQFDQHAG